MLKRLLAVAFATTAIVTGVPQAASAYPTTMCEDNASDLLREFHFSDSGRTVFVGVEQTTPLADPAFGFRLCVEVNSGGSNVVGYDIGFGVFYDTLGGLRLRSALCGVADEATCTDLVGWTGVTLPLAGLPSAGITDDCFAVVGPLCLQSPYVSYGGGLSNPIVVLWVNGIAVPIALAENCVSVPPTTC